MSLLFLALTACTTGPAAELALGDLSPLSEAQAQQAGVNYGLSGTLYVQVYKNPDTVGAAVAHDHVVRAAAWNGSVTWDPNNLAACKVNITVPVNSLSVDEKALRERLGYTTFPSDSERADIKESMLGASQLDAAKFPSISFASTKCEANGDLVNVTGNMTIHGVTKSIVTPMSIKADAVNFSAKGSMKIKGSSYGIEPYSALLGAVKNQDTMILVVDVLGTPR